MTTTAPIGAVAPSPYDHHTALDLKTREVNRAMLMAALAARGVTTATVSYEGSCDSGGVEDVTWTPDEIRLDGDVDLQVVEWGQTEPMLKTVTLKDAVEEYAMQIMTDRHGGYENNEGGSGEVVFDIAAAEITIDHRDYYREVEHTMTVC